MDEVLPCLLKDVQRDASENEVTLMAVENPVSGFSFTVGPRLQAWSDRERQFVQFYPLAALLTGLPLPTILQDYGTESDRNDRATNGNH